MPRDDKPSPKELAASLAYQIDDLCRELLSAGRRSGRYWQVGGVDNSRGSSMWVHLSGAKRGNWQDAATGEFGDALDLAAACLFRGDVKAAYAWAADRCGHGRDAADRPRPRPEARPDKPAQPSEDDQRRRDAALAMWLKAEASIVGTPVDHYLRERRIDLRELGRQPRSLRYHPALYHAETQTRFPAMVAAISDQSGRHIATHRTWLECVDGRWRKARVSNPKMSFGMFAGGSIRLWRGASRKPLANAAPDEPVILCEGIETGLSIAISTPEFRVLCGISLGNLGAVELPAHIRMVILCPEADDKPAALAAFNRVANRHLAAGREVRLARAAGGKDFNDVLQDGP